MTDGLHRKYDVHRVDGRDQLDGDKSGARYFVLDYAHDRHARIALIAYAASCEGELPQLAEDLWRELNVTPYPTVNPGEMPDGWVPKEQAVNVRPIGTYPPKFCGKDEPHAPHDYNVVSASSISGSWWRCQGRYDPPINFCGSTVRHAAHNSHQMSDDGMPMWRCLGFQPIGRPQA